jgi:proline iminopeptidase
VATAEQINFGLSPAIIASLRAIFAKYRAIEKVLIFGSRAKGTAKPSSDIDLAVFAPAMSAQQFTELWSELDNLPLVFKLDVLHWDTLDNGDLKAKIKSEGKKIYPAG